jgi:hypothetical protein
MLALVTTEEQRRAEIAAVAVSLGAGLIVGLLAQVLGARPLPTALATGATIAASSVVFMRI